MGDKEEVFNTCPSRLISEVSEFFHIHAWAERGRLQYMYPFDELPAIVGEALDVIENEQAARESYSFNKARGANPKE